MLSSLQLRFAITGLVFSVLTTAGAQDLTLPPLDFGAESIERGPRSGGQPLNQPLNQPLGRPSRATLPHEDGRLNLDEAEPNFQQPPASFSPGDYQQGPTDPILGYPPNQVPTNELGIAPTSSLDYVDNVGAHLRARYNSRSYGQTRGNFDLGSMMVEDYGDSASFLDGQITLNDDTQIGYNVGAGLRWHSLPLFSFGPDAEKLMGASIWLDGSSTPDDHFFSQIGLSLEMLGERVDFRANGYLPVGNNERDTAMAATGEFDFIDNTLSQLTSGSREIALTAAEFETAFRVQQDRDFWLFAGGYGLSNAGFDTVGFRGGMRGYATPDLMLQLAVTQDDLFDTNVVFGATWFIGRTRTNTRRCNNLRDRFREPVLRNDYVPVYTERLTGGTAMRDNTTNQVLRFTHVDSAAAAGGDGTVERPLNSLDNLAANSQAGDRVLVYSDSSLNAQTATLQNDQQLLGLGTPTGSTTPATYQIDTRQLGNINLPSPTAAASAGAMPQINDSTGPAVVLAQNNRVENLAINRGVTAIQGTSADIGGVTLANLEISDTTGDGITLAPTAQTAAFSANISDVTFSGVGGDDLDINANNTPTPGTATNAINISNIESDNVGGESLRITSTKNNQNATVTNYDYNGGTTGDAGVRLSNTAGNVNINGTSPMTGGAAGGRGIITQNTSGTVTVGNQVAVTNTPGTAVEVNNASAAVNYSGAITNNSGRAVLVQNNTAAVTFNGAIADTGNSTAVEVNGSSSPVAFNSTLTNSAGNSLVINSTSGNVSFGANADINDTGSGVRITNNTDGDITFLGEMNVTVGDAGVNGIEITGNNANTRLSLNDTTISTTTGTGVLARGDGDLLLLGDTINTTGGTALDLEGVSVTSVSYNSVNVSSAGSLNAIRLADLGGTGAVTVGNANQADNAGGTIRSTGDTVAITNAPNVVLRNMSMASNGNRAVNAVYTGSAANYALTLDNLDANENITVNSTAAASGDVSFTLNGDSTANDVSVTTANGGNATIDVSEAQLFGSLNVSANNDDDLELTINNTQIVSGSSAATIALRSNLNEADVQLTNNTFDAADASALAVTAEDVTTRFEISDGGTTGDANSFTNNSATAATVDFEVSNQSIFDLTFNTDNSVTNSNAAATSRALDITATGAGTSLDLNLEDLQVTASGTNDILFEELASATFSVFERDATIPDPVPGTTPRNQGTIDLNSGTNSRIDFDDLPSASNVERPFQPVP